jgi:hypothetical protein
MTRGYPSRRRGLHDRRHALPPDQPRTTYRRPGLVAGVGAGAQLVEVPALGQYPCGVPVIGVGAGAQLGGGEHANSARRPTIEATMDL